LEPKYIGIPARDTIRPGADPQRPGPTRGRPGADPGRRWAAADRGSASSPAGQTATRHPDTRWKPPGILMFRADTHDYRRSKPDIAGTPAEPVRAKM